MKKTDLMEAVGGIDRTLIEEHIKKKERLARGKRIRRAIVRYGAVAAALVLICLPLAALIAEQGTVPGQDTISGIDTLPETLPPVTDEFVLPADIDDILWGNGNPNSGLIADKDPTESRELTRLLEKASDDTYIGMTVMNISLDINGFVYNGKSYAEYVAEHDEILEFLDKISIILNEGDKLKYGELLYTVGTPEGEKWSRELYDKTIEELGEEFISQYIVDGVFLKEKALIDEKNAWNEEGLNYAKQLYAMKEFNKHCSAVAYEAFKTSGYCTAYRGGKCYLLIAKAEYNEIRTSSDEQIYRFEAAPRRVFDIPEFVELVLSPDVSFVAEKMAFDVLMAGGLTDDESVMRELNALIDENIYASDSLKIEISCLPGSEEKIIECLNILKSSVGNNGDHLDIRGYIAISGIDADILAEISQDPNVLKISLISPAPLSSAMIS